VFVLYTNLGCSVAGGRTAAGYCSKVAGYLGIVPCSCLVQVGRVLDALRHENYLSLYTEKGIQHRGIQ
jgi:hypothetical protein